MYLVVSRGDVKQVEKTKFNREGFFNFEGSLVRNEHNGFSHEFVPIMFQKNEKKNCKKTI